MGGNYNIWLKKNHQYYYQLQTYLGVYKYKKGYLCIYTPQGVLILHIDFYQDFWESLKNNLRVYYEKYYLKELFKNGSM